jgi:drug/metabolite transporter (DMT)-like permease
VVFGLSPIITGILATLILSEDALLPTKLLGMMMGLVGLALIFGSGYQSGIEFVMGISAVLLGTILHSLSAVLIKRFHARISGVAATTGGLTFATPLFIATWLFFEGGMPAEITPRAIWAILYLGVVGSSVGFALYYYILINMSVSRVALITLITPVTALTIGNVFNNEHLNQDILVGTGLIVSGLLLHEYGRPIVRHILRIR